MCKENRKMRANGASNICEAHLSQRASVVDCKNSAMNIVKLPSQPFGCDIDVDVSKAFSLVYNA